MSEAEGPLLAFSRDFERLKKPDDVVEALQDSLQHVESLRGVYHVMRVWYVSSVITDLAQFSDRTLFWQKDVPAAFRAEYLNGLRHYGPSITLQIVRQHTAPFTLTEARRIYQPTGEDNWVFDLMSKYGMRDALFCPFGRWALVYWSPRPVAPNRFERNGLSGAAYLAVTKIDRLVAHPEHLERQEIELTRREVEVLRLAANGLTQAEIATELEISRRTAEHHIESAIVRLGAKNITEACVQAMRYKFFS